DLTGRESWQNQLIEVALEAGGQHKSWQGFLQGIESLGAAVDQAVEARDQFDPTLANAPLPEQLEVVGDILAHLSSGGSLGFAKLLTKPTWKRFISEARLAGRQPSKLAHFETLQRVIR